MILGMIARVSLGHSGRALQIGRRITAAFALVILSALLRVLLPLLAKSHPHGMEPQRMELGCRLRSVHLGLYPHTDQSQGGWPPG